MHARLMSFPQVHYSVLLGELEERLILRTIIYLQITKWWKR
jgi:hypothetical protein